MLGASGSKPGLNGGPFLYSKKDMKNSGFAAREDGTENVVAGRNGDVGSKQNRMKAAIGRWEARRFSYFSQLECQKA